MQRSGFVEKNVSCALMSETLKRSKSLMMFEFPSKTHSAYFKMCQKCIKMHQSYFTVAFQIIVMEQKSSQACICMYARACVCVCVCLTVQ